MASDLIGGSWMDLYLDDGFELHSGLGFSLFLTLFLSLFLVLSPFTSISSQTNIEWLEIVCFFVFFFFFLFKPLCILL